ncbi:hypothetical protein [Streptomyces sp. NPDC058701]|uniref:hypothetical protein n=1 Tax=Streptomyces sp. NPDC058701 TaxID=3346608 RepID=UPI003668034F
MPDRRQPDSPTDDNPFAAPPEGRPDQPWQPRSGGDGNGGGGDGGNAPGNGPKDGSGKGGPARWDPTDPIQRHARYALLAGMWGFFFGIFGIPSVGLLLGALALYWGISALRGKPVAPASATATATVADVTGAGPRSGAGSAAAEPGAARGGLAALGAAARPQRTAAVSGLVAASLAILLALSSYGLQLAYKDFYVCRDDALTAAGELECNDLLPDNYVGDVLKVRQ